MFEGFDERPSSQAWDIEPKWMFRDGRAEVDADGGVNHLLWKPDAPAVVVAGIVFGMTPRSGTTGTPKGAMFGNRELEAIARADVPNFDDDASWGQGGPMLASTAFAHIGSMTKLPWYLKLGTTTHLLDRWRPADVLRLISEHHMVSVGGVAPQLWYFTVREDDIVQQLTDAVGKKVQVHYTEHRGIPTSCFGDTPYFVDQVKVVPE